MMNWKAHVRVKEHERYLEEQYEFCREQWEDYKNATSITTRDIAVARIDSKGLEFLANWIEKELYD